MSKNTMNCILGTRVTEQEFEYFEKIAKIRRQTVSDLLRQIIKKFNDDCRELE